MTKHHTTTWAHPTRPHRPSVSERIGAFMAKTAQIVTFFFFMLFALSIIARVLFPSLF